MDGMSATRIRATKDQIRQHMQEFADNFGQWTALMQTVQELSTMDLGLLSTMVDVEISDRRKAQEAVKN